jgi:hypothetical protein
VNRYSEAKGEKAVNYHVTTFFPTLENFRSNTQINSTSSIQQKKLVSLYLSLVYIMRVSIVGFMYLW